MRIRLVLVFTLVFSLPVSGQANELRLISANWQTAMITYHHFPFVKIWDANGVLHLEECTSTSNRVDSIYDFPHTCQPIAGTGYSVEHFRDTVNAYNGYPLGRRWGTAAKKSAIALGLGLASVGLGFCAFASMGSGTLVVFGLCTGGSAVAGFTGLSFGTEAVVSLRERRLPRDQVLEAIDNLDKTPIQTVIVQDKNFDKDGGNDLLFVDSIRLFLVSSGMVPVQ